MPSQITFQDKLGWAEHLIDKYKLDLSGLTVFTELVTGNYFFTSLIASMAGAKVIAVFKNEMLADYILMREETDILQRGKIETTDDKYAIASADIITNSGHVRPITEQDIFQMKKTAVIAAMMMPDQMRQEDIDLSACCDNGIMVVGTDEGAIGVLDSIGYKILKVLFDNGLSVWNDRYLLFASGKIGDIIKNCFDKFAVSVQRVSNPQLFDAIVEGKNIGEYDAIIMAEYFFKDKIDFSFVDKRYKIINIRNGDTYITGDYLSHKVTFELTVASLKVAEIAARQRIEGSSIEEAETHLRTNCKFYFKI